VRFVVEQSIDAILEGRDIGVSREEFQRTTLPPPAVVEPPRAPPAPAPPPEARARWLLAAGYEALAMGSGEVQQSARLAVAARFSRVQVALMARLGVPMSVAGGGAEARLWTGGAGLSASAAILGADSLALTAGLGAGLDLTHVAPSVTTSGLAAAAAFWAPGPWLQPFAALERRFGDVSLALAIGAELHPLAERYTVKNGSETVDVFVPWRLRPVAALLLGLVF
jgi:hypothetical protein